MKVLPKDELYKLYVEQFYTYQDLAKHFRCSTETVRFNIELHNIPKSQKGHLLFRRLKMKKEDFRDMLEEFYWKDQMTIDEIADYLETTQFTIWINLKRFGIERRSVKNRNEKKHRVP